MIIDSLYYSVIKKLTDEEKIRAVSSKLLSFKRNDERVLYVCTILQELNVMPSPKEVHKSETLSTYYRNLGNQQFKISNDYGAWRHYNLSLLFAPINTDNYTLAIANRSAVLYSMKKYKECLNDIDKVFAQTKYPEKLRDKLLKRQALSIDGLSKQVPDKYLIRKVEIDNILKMAATSDSTYTCANSKLQVVHNEKMGRHVIAKEDIDPGEVLVKEEPYLILLLQSQCLITCNYCLSKSANLYPCPLCCYSLYCSEECKEKAWKDYHHVECAIMPLIVEMQFSKLEWLALRTVIKARSEHDDWDTFYKAIEEIESLINTQFHGQVEVDGKWIYDSKYYASIHSLATNFEKRFVSDIFQKGVTAAVFLHMLKMSTDFMKSVGGEEDENVVKCVANLLLHHLMTTPTNMHGISCNSEDIEGNYVEAVSLASAPYAFLSLLNHSCTPNVVRMTKLGTGEMTLFALRPIKKGMQLFDNYGFHHAVLDRSKRRDALYTQYKFHCTCEACVDNWPTYQNLQPAQNLAAGLLNDKETLLDSNTIEDLQKANLDVALKVFKPLCGLLIEFEKYAPCVELADCQESLKQCLDILEGMMPYLSVNPVDWNVLPKS